MPCKDKSLWERTNEPAVLPPVYENKVGRPPKSRRKQPHEVQGKHGPQLSRHGTIITCSWCKGENHNRAGCPFRKLGMIDNPIQEPVITQVQISHHCMYKHLGHTACTNRTKIHSFTCRNKVHHKEWKMMILESKCGHKCLMR
jgi:hypothetical protein